jgi:hypothetical protein
MVFTLGERHIEFRGSHCYDLVRSLPRYVSE